jgi:predicted phage terminase large subunit-like protein
MDPNILQANYYQIPVDIKGRLFEQILTYEVLPDNIERIIGYCDTADEGDDFLCCIVGAVKQGEGYITDIYFTQDGMQVTEPKMAKMLIESDCSDCEIESNNGGKGFALNVRRIIWEKYKTRRVNIKWKHTSENKLARILTGATYVMNHIYLPANWAQRWPEFYAAIMGYQKSGGNKHDDAAETIVEFGKRICGDGNFSGLLRWMKDKKEKRDKLE